MSPVTGPAHFVSCSYEKCQPGYRDEKRRNLRKKTNVVKRSHYFRAYYSRSLISLSSSLRTIVHVFIFWHISQSIRWSDLEQAWPVPWRFLQLYKARFRRRTSAEPNRIQRLGRPELINPAWIDSDAELCSAGINSLRKIKIRSAV